MTAIERLLAAVEAMPGPWKGGWDGHDWRYYCPLCQPSGPTSPNLGELETQIEAHAHDCPWRVLHEAAAAYRDDALDANHPV